MTMNNVLVGVLHMISFVGGDHSKVSHETILQSKWILVLLVDRTNVYPTMSSMILDPIRVNIWVITASKFGEHLRSWKVAQTSLVHSAPVNNWDWGTVRNWSHRSLDANVVVG